ncbi:carbohydrate esterase [Duganella sp. FT80W]|uniref:Carbohydrate esterase n=2 Tax=Duganella guangzhouensis TaxID=2666084 RepID=A0A6I2L5U0_9BURK|nr:carbohydrate esterase [Duganella guangzhouensis]
MTAAITLAPAVALAVAAADPAAGAEAAVADATTAVTPALIALQPADGAREVNPDTHLVLRFAQPPVLGASGLIRIYDAATGKLVDTLDLSIPAGPTERTTLPQAPYLATPYVYADGPRATNATTKAGTPSTGADPGDPGRYQLTIIGGFTDGFHFHPVIVQDTSATIYPHNNLLAYGKRYRVQVDQAVFGKALQWEFSTKPHGPAKDTERVVVSADGSADFSTVQGALDHVPDHPAKRVTIFVRNGDYEEIVYFRNKRNLTIQGEQRDKVRIHYANNEVFNPHPPNISTNEVAGTFPSRRAAFAADNVRSVHLRDLTLETTLQGQAEGLLITGAENIVANTTIIGSGDALQVNGSTYLPDVKVIGGGDTILGRGPAFFERCEIQSQHAYMWIRNPAGNHGNVFVGCRFTTLGGGQTELARLPANKGRNYPYAEAVLIDATLSGISPAGWGPVEGDVSNVHFWEYNSRNVDGTPVDVSKRHPASRQLTMERDAETIRNYRNPAWVLDGWMPPR